MSVLLFLVGLVSVATAQTPVLLDFEDLAPGTPVYNQYPGVTFLGGDASPSLITIAEPPAGTVSGTRAVQAVSYAEFAGSGVAFAFDRGQHRVKLSVGLVTSYFYIPETLAILRGYDAAGDLVEESPIVSVGSAPHPVDVPLEITSVSGSVVKAVVTVLTPITYLSPDRVDLAIDNLEFAAPDDPPPPDLLAPFVRVTGPTESATVAGSTPGALDALVIGSVDEFQGLQVLTLQLNGGAPSPIAHGINVGGRYTFAQNVSAQDGLANGANQLVVHAQDFAGNSVDLVRNFTYAVLPVPPPSEVDFVPIGIEVNQAISHGPMYVFQAEPDGFSMTVPEWVTLVEGRDTLVRVTRSRRAPLAPSPMCPRRSKC